MRQALLVVGLIATISCGGGNRSLPATTFPSSPTPTPQGRLTLSGTVSETAPTASTRIPGVTVQVFCCGPNVGRSAMTDANGVFQLVGLEPGAFTIRTVSADYVEGSLAVTLTGNQTVGIELDPVFQIVTTTRNDSLSGGDECPGYWDYYPTGLCEVDYLFNIHHNGTLAASSTTTDQETAVYLDVFRAVAGRVSSGPLQLSVDGSVRVNAHTQYIVRLRKFSLGGGPPRAGVTPYSLTVTRPS